MRDDYLELANNLTRLLKHLNFSNICLKNHPEYPNPELNHIIKKAGYNPSVMAKKNGVIYYFEFIKNNPKDLKKLKQTLQKIIELGHERWDADFILVTKYSNKDTVREWCQNYNLPVDEIWEM